MLRSIQCASDCATSHRVGGEREHEAGDGAEHEHRRRQRPREIARPGRAERAPHAGRGAGAGENRNDHAERAHARTLPRAHDARAICDNRGMKRSTAAALGIGTAAAALIAFYLLRHKDKGSESEHTPDPWASHPGSDSRAARPRRIDQPSGASFGGEAPLLVDDDPKGTLRLEGQVLGDSDKPVAGAVVVLSSNPPRTATSEDDGSFAFDRLVARPYTLIARAPAGVAGPVTARLTAKSEPVILHLRPAGAVEVTVVDPKQKPVIGAAVELRSSMWEGRGGDAQTASTEARGIARFAPVVPGFYDVVAEAPGFARTSQSAVRVGEAKVEIQLALVTGSKVSGKVVDDGGAPVGNARVVFSGASDWATQGNQRLDGVDTTADGRFELPALPAGSWRFVARHPDHAPGTSALVTLDGRAPRTDVLIRMPAGATVRGRVIDAQSHPVAGARVRVGIADAGMVGEGPRQTYADDHGEFAVRGLPRRALLAIATGEDAASESVRVDASKGDVGDVVLKLDVTGTIAGTVVDERGKPLEGVQVNAFPDFASGRGGGDMAQWRLRGFAQDLTDGAGAFTLTGLAKGTYRIRATRSRHASRGRGFAGEGTSAETGTTNLKIVLPPEGGVKGKVAFSDGSAPGMYTVSVGFTQQPSSPDGSFLLDGLNPDHYTVNVRGNGFTPKGVEVDVKGGEIADVGTITVDKGRVISGKVVMQGAPVPGATVYAGRQIFGNGSSSDARFGGPTMAQDTRHTTTGDDGSFSLAGYGLGDVTIVAEEPTLGRSLGLRLIAGDPSEQNLTLELVAYGSLHGVLHKDGAPAEGVIVTAQSVASPGELYSVATGPDGAYRFDKLGAESFKVSAMLGMPMRGMRFYSKTVAVQPGKDATLDLQFNPGAVSLKVTGVVAGGGKAGFVMFQIATGALSPAPTIGRELQALMAAQGQGMSAMNFVPQGKETTFDQLDPGPYTVCSLALPAEVSGFAAIGEYISKHGDTLPVRCTPVTVAPTPTEQQAPVPITVPPYQSDGGSGKGGGGGGGSGKGSGA
jgi:uncharacterized GH25 family protein